MPIFNDMTNKEAAKVLNDYSTVNRNASLPYINEAIHAAIKALDQIDNIKAQNAEYKTRLGIDETVVPKDADTKIEIVWYEFRFVHKAIQLYEAARWGSISDNKDDIRQMCIHKT